MTSSPPESNDPPEESSDRVDRSARPRGPAKPRSIEREFGVPVPGRIVDPALWTQTALHKIPAGELNFPAMFGRTAPVVLDVGCGNGRSTLASAVWRESHDHLATDILPVVIRYATRRANQRGLKNVRCAVIGGRELLATHIAPGSIDEIHVYHPQPYYKPEEIPQRLITPEFLSLAHRALRPGGLFIIQTDHPGYWAYMQQVVPVFFDFQPHPNPWPDAPKGRTRREIIALRQGLPVFRGIGTARTDLSREAAVQRAEQLPLPVFNADRRLQQLDRLERE